MSTDAVRTRVPSEDTPRHTPGRLALRSRYTPRVTHESPGGGGSPLELARLLAPEGASVTALPRSSDVEAWVSAHLARHGCERPPPGADDDADVRHALYWILRMAERTCRRAEDPPPAVAPDLTAQFVALLGGRPQREDEHAQLHVDASSSLRRAMHVAAHVRRYPGPVLAVGDDDAVTLALALLGVPDLYAVDIDERILEFVADAARRMGANVEVQRVDVLDEPVPARLRQRCSAVLADPIRSYEPTLGFLLFGAAALRRDAPARLYWADDPDWTFEHDQVVQALEQARLSVVESHEDVHAYPLDASLFDLERIAAETSADPAWLRALIAHTRGWSGLYVLERVPTGTRR